MGMLQILHRKGNPMPIGPQETPYNQESIERALTDRRIERRRIARDMGIPSDLIALYEVFPDKIHEWTKVLDMLSAE